MFLGLGIYVSLFLSAFLAATIFPTQSEVGLAALIINSPSSVAFPILVASLGNIMGSAVNWYLGRRLQTFADKWWFPASTSQLSKAMIWYKKYGRWSLLLSWVPIIGDPLTLIAGLLREPLASFLLIIGLAKTTRYIVVGTIALSWSGS